MAAERRMTYFQREVTSPGGIAQTAENARAAMDRGDYQRAAALAQIATAEAGASIAASLSWICAAIESAEPGLPTGINFPPYGASPEVHI